MSATMCIGDPITQDTAAFVGLCESCEREQVKVIVVFEDGVTFAVCAPCANVAVDHSTALVSLAA